MMALLCLGAAFSMNVPGAQAQARTSCSGSDRTHTVVRKDTLSEIAHRYGRTLATLVSHNRVGSSNLILVKQVVCVPGSRSVRVSQPPRVSIPRPTTPTPSVQPPVPQSGSVASMIQQVFGSYAAGAIHVAACESGLNPGASNPISIGGSHAAGVFQILYPSTWAGTSEAANSPYDAWSNIVAAHEIFVRDGYSWHEWTCQP